MEGEGDVTENAPRIWLPGECAHETTYLLPAYTQFNNKPAWRCRDCGNFVADAPTGSDTDTAPDPLGAK